MEDANIYISVKQKYIVIWIKINERGHINILNKKIIKVTTSVIFATFLIISPIITANNCADTSKEKANLCIGSNLIIDLIIANHDDPNPENISILLGDGSGSFSDPLGFPAGMGALDLAVADFNDDGFLDVVVSKKYGWDLSILFGDGDGNFGSKYDYSPGVQPLGIVTGDFNGDGNSDIAAGTAVGNKERYATVFLGDGTGIITSHQHFNVGDFPSDITTGDFDNDGDLDLATANYDYGTITVLLGDNNGTFGERSDYDIEGDIVNPKCIISEDFNKDGNLDLAVTNFFKGISVFLGVGDGTFGNQHSYATMSGEGPVDIEAADFNGDGNLDLASTNFFNDTVSVLLGTNTGAFGDHQTYKTGHAPHSVASHDFNNDGYIDLAVTNKCDNDVSILFGDGTGAFGGRQDFPAGNGPREILAVPIRNQPPITPIVTGPSKGTIKVGYEYIFNSSDPDGNDMFYFVDWGDENTSGWQGPYKSGEGISLNYTWNKKGTYIIKAKVKDVFDLESEWGRLEVKMPKYQIPDDNKISKLFDRLLSRFPILIYYLEFFKGDQK